MSFFCVRLETCKLQNSAGNQSCFWSKRKTTRALRVVLAFAQKKRKEGGGFPHQKSAPPRGPSGAEVPAPLGPLGGGGFSLQKIRPPQGSQWCGIPAGAPAQAWAARVFPQQHRGRPASPPQKFRKFCTTVTPGTPAGNSEKTASLKGSEKRPKTAQKEKIEKTSGHASP